MYRALQSKQILKTANRLRSRIHERFPDSGLAEVGTELCEIAEETQERCRSIRAFNYPLRIGALLLAGLAVTALVVMFTHVRITDEMWDVQNVLEELEAGLGSLVFLGAAIVFLLTIETRMKRSRALRAINELRALAHIVDMHQLTKDPEPILTQGPATAASPTRTMTPFELSRYFDYCSELLSMTSKVGALYVQAFPDPVALSAVDEIEALTSGLSRKIWQKIMILDRFNADEKRAAREARELEQRQATSEP
jgi:hypothetical protein